MKTLLHVHVYGKIEKNFTNHNSERQTRDFHHETVHIWYLLVSATVTVHRFFCNFKIIKSAGLVLSDTCSIINSYRSAQVISDEHIPNADHNHVRLFTSVY